MVLRPVYVLAFFLSLASLSWADEVILKSGISLKGQVVGRNSRQVAIMSSGRKMTYKTDDVVSVKLDPLPEFEEGKKHLAEGNVAAAIRAFERVLSGPRVLFQEDARAELVFCYFRSGRPDDAVAAFLDMVREAPDSRHRWRFPWHYEGELGNASRIRKEIESARHATGLRSALEAWVALVSGNIAEAQSKIPFLLRDKDPVVAGVGIILQIRLLYQSKDLEECMKLAAQQKPKAPDDVQPWLDYWRGRCFLAKKDYPRAALAFLHVPTLYPQNECLAGDSLYLVGQCFEKMGETDRARREYAALMSQFPAAMAADQARKRAGALK
ncbi:MAG: tetratricopeptide repeat protein [Planctomycetes bacterium]|nr:tetratricopeptide repeat protein [Planctomycetota bacterium]